MGSLPSVDSPATMQIHYSDVSLEINEWRTSADRLVTRTVLALALHRRILISNWVGVGIVDCFNLVQVIGATWSIIIRKAISYIKSIPRSSNPPHHLSTQCNKNAPWGWRRLCEKTATGHRSSTTGMGTARTRRGRARAATKWTHGTPGRRPGDRGLGLAKSFQNA